VDFLDPNRPGQRWFSTVLIILSTTVAFTIWAADFPLLTIWVRELGISRAQGGLLTGLFYLPGLFLALPGGWLLDRYSSRLILALAWVTIVLGTGLMSLAPGFLVLCLGRLLLSTGMWVHQVGAPRLLGIWFSGRKRLGLAMALYTWSFTIGTYLSLTFVGRLAVAIGWRQALSILTLLSLLALLLMLVVPHNASAAPAEAKSPAPQPGSSRPFQLGWLVWLAAIAYLFFNSGSDSYYTFTPDYLVTRGYALARASALVGLYAWVAFVLKPLCSLFLNRRTAPIFVIVGSACAIAAFGLLLLPRIYILPLTLLVGASLAFCMPALVALPSLLLPPRLTGQGYGLLCMIGSLELFASPVIGYSIDRTGKHLWAYGIMAAYCLLAMVAALLIHVVSKRQEVIAAGGFATGLAGTVPQ
jgi:cyanate permease